MTRDSRRYARRRQPGFGPTPVRRSGCSALSGCAHAVPLSALTASGACSAKPESTRSTASRSVFQATPAHLWSHAPWSVTRWRSSRAADLVRTLGSKARSSRGRKTGAAVITGPTAEARARNSRNLKRDLPYMALRQAESYIHPKSRSGEHNGAEFRRAESSHR